MNSMQLQIVKPGLLATIQDAGRFGYRWQGMPVSGVMDAVSARLANMALGNDADAALIEFNYAGAVLLTQTDVLLAWAGEGTVLHVGEVPIPAGRPVFIPQGKTICLKPNSAGCLTYVAIAGGFDVPMVLGSRSTYLTTGTGGFNGRCLQAGDTLNSVKKAGYVARAMYKSLRGKNINYVKWSLKNTFLTGGAQKTIRVMPANEFTWFAGQSLIGFLSQPYTVGANSNRMGYSLLGNPVERVVNREVLSTAVTAGTIQVTGNGSLIMLMADCQTTGGYARIAQVAAVDMALCAQLKPNDIIYFKEISRHEAEMLYIEREQQLQKLANAINNKYV